MYIIIIWPKWYNIILNIDLVRINIYDSIKYTLIVIMSYHILIWYYIVTQLNIYLNLLNL